MSSLVYPTLPGVTFNSIRAPQWTTGVQTAVSRKQTTIAYQQYPVIKYTLIYEFLRDTPYPNVTTSEIKALFGLFMQMQGRYDTFLYTDPEFNSVTLWNYAVGNGSQVLFPVTAIYENVGGPGVAELIQNFNGTPSFYINRFGLNELMSGVSRTNYLLQSQTWATTWTQNACTITSNSTVAPDGTTTADSIKETTATSAHGISQAVTVPSAVEDLTLTVYLNPNLTRTWAFLSMTEATGGTVVSAYFNLSGAGAVGTVATGANWSAAFTSITACNGGFYCCVLNATKTNAATSITAAIDAATANGTNSYTGSTSDGVTGWGAQLEVGLNSTMYLPTTTGAVTQADYTLGPTTLINAGYISMTAAPVNNATLLWSGSFYYRCRFEEDAQDFTKFMSVLWELKKVEFMSVIQ